MKDCRGVEVKPLQTVVHMSRSGSWQSMEVGVVKEVHPNHIVVEYERGGTGRPYVSNNLMVVQGVPYIVPEVP